MPKMICKTTELTDRQIRSLYILHEYFYFKRGRGFGFKQWRHNLLRSYHYSTSKKVQIVTDSFSEIIGYSIFTSPICINGLYWSKILEGGLKSNNSQNDFVNMIVDLTENNWRNPVWFFGEISLKSRIVLELMKQSGFNNGDDRPIIKNVLSVCLMSNDFELFKDDGLIIKRKTGLDANYFGNVITKEGDNIKNTFLKEKEYSPIMMDE